MIRTVVTYCLIILISFAFLNVLVVDDELYDPTRTGKVIFLLRYIPYLAVLGIPVMSYQIRKQPDAVTLLVLAFYGWMWLVGRPGGIWHDEKFLYWTAGVVFFLLTRPCITYSKSNIQKYHLLWIPVIAITVLGGMEVVIGQLQIFDRYTIYHSLYKVTGTFFNPAPYAGFLVACLPYALTMANPQEKTKLMRILSWLGLLSSIMIVSILPATQSRAGWLAFAVSGAYWAFHHFGLVTRLKTLYFHKRRQLLIASSSIILLILVSGFGLYHYKKDSADGRLLIWKASAQLVSDQPMLGHGFNTFQAHYAPALADYFVSGKGNEQEEMLAGNVQWAFNEPLQYAVELGLSGLLLFLGIVGYAFICPLKETTTPEEGITNQQKQLVYTARASLAGIMVFGLFSYPFHSPAITLLFFFALAIIAGYAKGINLKYFSVALQVVLVLLISLFAVYSIVQTPKLKQAYWLWDEAGSLYKIKAYEAANESFEEALPVLQANGLFMQQYGKSLYMAERYGEALSSLEQGRQFYRDDFWYITMGDTHKALGEPVKAEQYYKGANQMVPHKLYPKYLLAKLYNDNGHSETSEAKAKAMAQDILASKVKVMSAAVEEIRQEMQDILDKQIAPLGVKPGNEERKVSLETHKPSAPSSLHKGKEVQR